MELAGVPELRRSRASIELYDVSTTRESRFRNIRSSAQSFATKASSPSGMKKKVSNAPTEHFYNSVQQQVAGVAGVVEAAFTQ